VADIDAEQLQILSDAIDRMHDELLKERDLGFATEAEKKAFFFERHKRAQRRVSAQSCMYPGCTNQSIKRSHTLPRSGPLERIAEDGHVTTTEFDRTQGAICAKRLGVREASTFPGFCDAHEMFFQEFEQRKRLDSIDDHVRQLFRIVCREIRVRELQVATGREMAVDLKQLLNERGTELLNRILRDTSLSDRRVTSVSFEEFNRHHTAYLRKIEDMESRIRNYREDFFEPLLAEMSGQGVDALAVTNFTVGVEAPVCLAGRGNFRCKIDDEVRETIAFAQVWPFDGGTQITLLTRTDREVDRQIYLSSFLRKPLGLLSLIESWMVHGTDHWFVRPAIWNALPPERQKRILTDIADESRNVGSEYPLSIFDEIRLRALAQAEPKDTSEEEDLAREKAKVTT
jgi:hypothetical protein